MKYNSMELQLDMVGGGIHVYNYITLYSVELDLDV